MITLVKYHYSRSVDSLTNLINNNLKEIYIVTVKLI